MLMVNNLVGFGAGGATPSAVVAASQTDTGAASSGGTDTFSFTSKSFGAASSDRQIVVFIAGSGITSGRTISSVTIGGVSATQIVAATNNQHAGIWSASVPTGTTGTVTVVWSGADMTICGCVIYAMTGASTTAHDTGSDITPSGSDMSDTINVAANGAVIAGVHMNQSPTLTASWTGVTEDVDQAVSGNNTISAAHDEFASTETGRTITATLSASPSIAILCVASWGPSS